MSILDKDKKDIRLTIRHFASCLASAGIPKPRLEAEHLLAQAVRVSRAGLYMEDGISSEDLGLAGSWLKRRLEGEPLQYLFGSVDFFGTELSVGPGVFIPRPETEIVSEKALCLLRERQSIIGGNLSVLDLGTGSANLAITIAKEFRSCLVVAVDISLEALCIASRNVSRNGLSSQVMLVQSDWDEAIKAEFDLVVSNPPYVPSNDIVRIPFGSKGDPVLSLDGGEDGMNFYRRLAEKTGSLLKPGASLCLECAEEQAGKLFDFYRNSHWAASISAFNDLTGRSRGIIVKRR